MTDRRGTLAALALASAALLTLAPHDADAGRRRGGLARTGGSFATASVPYALGPILEVYGGNDRVVATAANYRMYRHQPSCATSPTSGDFLCAHRAGLSHASEDDQIVITRSDDGGVTWSDRRTELDADPNDGTMQQIAALSFVGTRAWIVGTDADISATPSTRVCWTRYSDDDGLTWSAKNFGSVPSTGTANITTCGGGRGIYEADNGDLVFGLYSIDTVPPTRYVAHFMRLAAASATTGRFTVTATLAIDTVDQTDQFEEPNCGLLRGTTTHVCLLRVDNEPLVAVDPNRGNIYMVRSTDDGATWSAPALVYQGRGTPAWTELTNGTLVAGNRGRGTGVVGAADEGFRGELWYSRDAGLSWSRGGEFQHPLAGLEGIHGGGYMGASLWECDTNVACIMSSQDIGAIENQQAGLYFRTAAFDGARSRLDDFVRSEYAIRYPVGGGGYINYGAQNTLNAATRWTLTFRWRYPYNATDLTNPTGDQVVISRHPAGQRHLDVRIGASQRLYVYTGATLSTLATFTSASLTTQITSSPWVHVVVSYDGTQATNATRLRTFVEEVEITGGGSYSGTIPASMTSPTTAVWQLGANAGANTARGMVDDVALWVGETCTGACVSDLYNGGAPGDYRQALIGPPDVYIDAEDAAFADRMGTWPAPTVTGAVTRETREKAARWGNPTDTYPAWFLATLEEPARTLLADPTLTGSSPFWATPSGTSWTESGADITNFGTPTITADPPYTTTLVSGGTLGDPAGLFTDAGASRVFTAAAGWVAHSISTQTPHTLGVRGAAAMFASQFDLVNFNPKGAADVIGWLYDPTDDPADGYWWCVDTTCTALGSAAPRVDTGRTYGALIAVRPGAGADGGYRILVDLTNPHRPRVADSGFFTVSAVDRFAEWNASQGVSFIVADRTQTWRAHRPSGRFLSGVLVYPGW